VGEADSPSVTLSVPVGLAVAALLKEDATELR
jgi:hypothetical protein